MSGKILVAGATGYLGRHIVQALVDSGREFAAIARNRAKLSAMGVRDDQIVSCELTDVSQVKGICHGYDIVISCLGITRQKDGLTYQDVDFQANLNLLLDAESAGVKQFLYVSAFKAQEFPQVRLLRAKERFAQRLQASDIPHPIVVRPNGFFSDLEAYLDMARSGRAYVLGDGSLTLNPIHGADLAQFILSALDEDKNEWNVGGPDILTTAQIAEAAFAAVDKPVKIQSLPIGLINFLLPVLRLMPESWVGPAEFFLTAGRQDMVAPQYGSHHLAEHFQTL